MRIHAIDIVQPPGIGMPSIAAMDVHQTIVARHSLRTAAQRRRETRDREALSLVVLVMVAPPEVRLVATFRSAVEPLVSAPEPSSPRA